MNEEERAVLKALMHAGNELLATDASCRKLNLETSMKDQMIDEKKRVFEEILDVAIDAFDPMNGSED